MNRALQWLVIVIAVLFGMAPTVGDVGSCGQSVEELDPVPFFGVKAALDCDRCTQCGITTKACDVACRGELATKFAPLCKPLVHDGEVCLHALQFASCDDYASYMSDAAPTAPRECQFCPLP